MIYHPVYGIAAPELGWVPAPSYIMRRAAILELLVGLSRGRVVETGCGAGALLYDLAGMGFTGVGIEQSLDALSIAEKVLHERKSIGVVPSLDAVPNDTPFDYLFAFEVLEHIEDDRSVLSTWSSRLRAGGLVLISVPAHRGAWDASDEWAGHYRRYDRGDITALLQSCNLSIISVQTYGWPLANLIKPLRAVLKRRGMGSARGDKSSGTARSGIDRADEARYFPWYSSLPGRLALRFFIFLQWLARTTDWGTGYLVTARKGNV